jgi:hypothetical protein
MDLFLQLRSARGDRLIASRTWHSRSTPPPHPINLRNHARLQCRTTALQLISILSPPSRQGGYCVNRETPKLHRRLSFPIFNLACKLRWMSALACFHHSRSGRPGPVIAQMFGKSDLPALACIMMLSNVQPQRNICCAICEG